MPRRSHQQYLVLGRRRWIVTAIVMTTDFCPAQETTELTDSAHNSLLCISDATVYLIIDYY